MHPRTSSPYTLSHRSRSERTHRGHFFSSRPLRHRGRFLSGRPHPHRSRRGRSPIALAPSLAPSLALSLSSALAIAVALPLCLALLVTALPAAASPTRIGHETPLDGFTITHLPPRIGPLVSDFTYEPDDDGGATFTSRVWERRTRHGHTVDLTVIVIRATHLTTLSTLRTYMADHHDRPLTTWHATRVGPHQAFRDATHVFWLPTPGVALSVRLAPHFAPAELKATAEGIHPAPTHQKPPASRPRA
ncbi:hypothetical protein ACIBH1_40000 [Nonomuraea sp. NPDC050663]|uniref:hypothetical protein n=1 Tax=Nonomuraea sp. NPDC050663 TaxID=3364370 RepID=UPI0037914D2B